MIRTTGEICNENDAGDTYDNDAGSMDEIDAGNIDNENDENDDEDTDTDSIIEIDREDERAVELSQIQTITKTLVLTIRKQTQCMGGQIISTNTSMEREYYGHYD